MAGFPLLDLNSIHLEKVVNKLEGKIYCRLQQTCKDLKEFIGTNRKISVFLVGQYQIQSYSLKGKPFQISFQRSGEVNTISAQALYGTRLNILCIAVKISFDQVCDVLQKYRITCNRLISKTYLKKEQLIGLLGILKPAAIDVNCCGNNHEALWESKTLKVVQVGLDVSAAVDTMPTFLTTFEEVTLNVGLYIKEQFAELTAILQIFLSQFWPNVRRFELSIGFRLRPGPTEDEWKELLAEFTLKETERSRREVIFDVEDLPPHLPRGSSLQLVIRPQGQGGCNIRFIRNPQSV